MKNYVSNNNLQYLNKLILTVYLYTNYLVFLYNEHPMKFTVSKNGNNSVLKYSKYIISVDLILYLDKYYSEG